MKQLIHVAIKNENGKIFSIYYKNELIAATFILVDKHRIINLISATNEIGKKMGAIHFINDYIIKTHINSELIFDFEGSMIPGVARFFKSFGAERIGYKVISRLR
jgi:hypothetical protein